MQRFSNAFFRVTSGSRQSVSIFTSSWSSADHSKSARFAQRLHACRVLSSQALSPVRKDGQWRDLPQTQRQAWEALGWTRESWDGVKSAPVSEMKTWEELTPHEQGAAQYGLGYTRETWNAELEESSLENVLMSSTQDPAAAPSHAATHPSGKQTNSALKKAWDLGMRAIPFVKTALASSPDLRRSRFGMALGAAAELFTEVDEVVHGPVIVNSTENIVYLDDSGSMSGSRLSKAHGLWGSMSQKLNTYPTRIVKFGSTKTVLVPRSELSSTTALTAGAGWNATSGTTYLWHMILTDVQANYRPGSGLLRVFVVTDGSDTDSPSPYSGMAGMDPMMQDLKAQGFDIEFHIVFVSSDLSHAVSGIFGTDTDLKRYEDLALATGGGFLHLTGFEDPGQVDRFLERIAHDKPEEAERLRLEAKQVYESRVHAGESTKFDWYGKVPLK